MKLGSILVLSLSPLILNFLQMDKIDILFFNEFKNKFAVYVYFIYY